MKWKKFREKLAQNPFLGDDLTWRSRTNNNKEFVRTKVGFIAFRPFESLDLSSKDSSTNTPLTRIYPNVPMDSWLSVEHSIVMHVQGEPDGSRRRYLGNNVGDESIGAHIEDLVRWFQGCKAHEGKQLVFERVVKRTVSASSYAGLTNMNLEIYPFPKYYRFRPIPRAPLPPADLAMKAYLSGAPMPPIIPGPISARKV